MFADRPSQEWNLHEMTHHVTVQHLLTPIVLKLLEGLGRFRGDFEVWRLFEDTLDICRPEVST